MGALVAVSSVKVFPLHRRRQLVSGIARVLSAKQGDEANRFWRDTAKELLRQLGKSGISLPQAEEEVRTLLHYVLAEMQQQKQAAV
jgi:hypothetical protein